MKIEKTIHGIHHITAICSSPAANVVFYENVLGLRLVKQTVNFDDPFTYHLYYGDQGGRPGTILTFFPWEGMRQGEAGAGMVTATAFAIPADSLSYWLRRLQGHGVEVSQDKRFGEAVLSFTDPHGLRLELIATNVSSPLGDTTGAEGDARHRIRGLHSATALVRSAAATERLLTAGLGLVRQIQEGNRIRFVMENDEGVGRCYDLRVDPEAPTGRQGSGTVHHLAFRAGSDHEQVLWQQALRDAGYAVSEIRDRTYFKSIYFHEPGGVLFEIATDPPGFTVDERPEELGRSLKLPSQFESMRGQIGQHLPALRGVEFKHLFVAPDDGETEPLAGRRRVPVPPAAA